MASFRSDFLHILDQRGFLYQGSDLGALDALMRKKQISAYIGFDATAPSLHVGHLTQIMMLYWLQQTGHRAITLMGGGTTRVGDPSGRDEVRSILSEDEINANIASIKRTFSCFLRYDEADDGAIMADNADWLVGLSYLPFLRTVGKHFSINRMLTMDSVRSRLDRDHSLSFLEFNYMILQAYDFVELHRRYGVCLQLGGSDQWGNIVQGVELGRRLDGADLFALTCPLVTTASGTKMGKTASGAVWLEASKISPYAFWQYWRDCADADVGRFLRLFSTLPMDEIARLESLKGSEINEAKVRLADDVTARLHGESAALEASKSAQSTFVHGEADDNLPSLYVSKARLDEGLGLLDAFVEAGLCESKGEVRRLVRGGAIRVNGTPVENENLYLGADDLVNARIRLSRGRKVHGVVIATS